MRFNYNAKICTFVIIKEKYIHPAVGVSQKTEKPSKPRKPRKK
jgi:hypothetical protein